MCSAMQEIINEELKAQAIKTVKQMYSKGYSIEIAYDIFNNRLTLDEVKAIYDEEEKKQGHNTQQTTNLFN